MVVVFFTSSCSSPPSRSSSASSSLPKKIKKRAQKVTGAERHNLFFVLRFFICTKIRFRDSTPTRWRVGQAVGMINRIIILVGSELLG